MTGSFLYFLPSQRKVNGVDKVGVHFLLEILIPVAGQGLQWLFLVLLLVAHDLHSALYPNGILDPQAEQFVDNRFLAAYGTLATDKFKIIRVVRLVERYLDEVFGGLRVPVLELSLLPFALEDHYQDKRSNYERKDSHQGDEYPSGLLCVYDGLDSVIQGSELESRHKHGCLLSGLCKCVGVCLVSLGVVAAL